jgi:hypothetical protein
MRVRQVGFAVAAVAVVLALASCSSPGAAERRESGIPEGVDLPAGEGPHVIALPDGRVQVVTFGSSSCPPTATSLSNDGNELVVSFDIAMGGNCTADINPTTHTFSADDVGSKVPEEATVRFPQLEEEVVVEVLRP